MNEVMSNPENGYHIKHINMTDSRWPEEEGWIKMQQVFEIYIPKKFEEGEIYPRSVEKYNIVIHYVYNPQSGQFDDFKFKD